MKTILFSALTLLFACTQNCDKTRPVKCNDRPPTGEACTALFQRWFYNESLGKCESISYSGCSSLGFSTREACESCGCH